MFLVLLHDHLEHETIIGEFDNIADARKEFSFHVSSTPDVYDYGYEIVDNSNDEFETIEWQVVQEEPRA